MATCPVDGCSLPDGHLGYHDPDAAVAVPSRKPAKKAARKATKPAAQKDAPPAEPAPASDDPAPAGDTTKE